MNAQRIRSVALSRGLAVALLSGVTAVGLAIPVSAAPKSVEQQRWECETQGGTWIGTAAGAYCAGAAGTIFQCDARGNCDGDTVLPRKGEPTSPTLDAGVRQ